MREALISDIHGNYKGLEEALKLLYKEGYDRLFCLGDVVPRDEKETQDCIDIINQKCDIKIRGNHDEWALHGLRFESQRINDYLKASQLIVREDDIAYAHMSPCHDYNFNDYDDGYVYDQKSADRAFAKDHARVIIIGHSHIPAAFCTDEITILFEDSGTISLDKNLRYILTVGSVAESRDKNDAVSCAIYDKEASTFTILRGKSDISHIFNFEKDIPK